MVFKCVLNGRWKIVLVINVVEIFVIILGIKYVVDIGVVKEFFYDLRKKVSVLCIVKVIKSFVD